MNTNERRVVVAVDESEESMHALSWCLNNLFSPDTNNTLVLLYVKPPLPVHSSFDAAGYIFSNDVIKAVEKYASESVNSVMNRAEAVYRNFQNNVSLCLFIINTPVLFPFLSLLRMIFFFFLFTDTCKESSGMWRCQGCNMWYCGETGS
ncbi:hypothetical protein CICLE_v10022542mg [Citrus x clementina]|uniref:UspA domain-containing protein n=1 Tax=Citrus clementina TaxID=85681 RepID=V4U138_CITCL|nr:hypothetical protein CICLE_v10022542mg [Citrus x clementina]